MFRDALENQGPAACLRASRGAGARIRVGENPAHRSRHQAARAGLHLPRGGRASGRSNGYFVGHNRIDILVHRTHGATGKAYYVAAIELKTLRESLHCRERAHEVEQQTRGYMRCLRSVFANTRVFHVFTVNFRRAEPDVEVLALEEKRPIKT